MCYTPLATLKARPSTASSCLPKRQFTACALHSTKLSHACVEQPFRIRSCCGCDTQGICSQEQHLSRSADTHPQRRITRRGVCLGRLITAMSKKNRLAARREAHERLLERERQQKAKKEAKRLKFQARAPKKRSIPKGLVRGSSRNPEQYEEARRIVKLRKKAARTAPKKMDLEKSGTEKRRAAATEGRKSARQKVIDKRRSMEM